METMCHCTMVVRCCETIIQIEPTKFHDIVQVRHSYLDVSKLKSYGFRKIYNTEMIIENLVDFYKEEMSHS